MRTTTDMPPLLVQFHREPLRRQAFRSHRGQLAAEPLQGQQAALQGQPEQAAGGQGGEVRRHDQDLHHTERRFPCGSCGPAAGGGSNQARVGSAADQPLELRASRIGFQAPASALRPAVARGTASGEDEAAAREARPDPPAVRKGAPVDAPRAPRRRTAGAGSAEARCTTSTSPFHTARSSAASKRV